MEYGTTDCNRSRLLAEYSVERLKAEHNWKKNTYYKQRISELKEQLCRFAWIEKTLNNVLQETNGKLRESNKKLKYARSRLAVADQHAQEMYAELVRIHTQSEENTYYKQRISELKEQLYRFAWNEKMFNHVLQETNGKLRQSNEELKYAQSRLAEEIRDLRKRLETAESSKRTLSIQLQQSREDLKSTNEELKRTHNRLAEVDQHAHERREVLSLEISDLKQRLNEARASEEDNSHSQHIRDLKTLLEQSQNNERALQHQLRQTKEKLKKITDDFAETKIKETSQEKDREFNSFLQRSKLQVNITKELQDTQRRLNEVNQMAQMKEKSLQREISELRQNKNELKLKNETLHCDLQQTRANLRKTTLEFEKERKRQNETLDGIRIQLNDKSQEVSDLRRILDISKAKEATFNNQMQHLQDKLQKATSELEDTKTRLSKLMGQQLTDNNPNITDLSDKNRPTKLSERFSELYDNEWTDSFQVLVSINKDERTTVITLITILKDAEKYCREEAEKQMERLRKALTLNMETGGSDIPSLINKQIKDCRKALATEAGQHLFEVYTKELSQKSPTPDSAKSALRVEAFLREAFMLCWLMSIQDPPVVFDRLLQHGEEFSTELYRSYTKSGPLVDFPVWPTMFLHEGGPVLYKGVAQGCHK